MGKKTVKKPTLETIARISGLAIPTVSRALNDASDISLKTRKSVQRIAAEVGYLPDRAGLALRTGRTNTVSLALSTDHDVMNQTARLISSIAEGLNGTPFHLIVTPYSPDEDHLNPVRYVIETGSADAIILNQIENEDKRVKYLLERGFPFATHGRSNWADRHAYFDYDNREFAYAGANTLVEAGCRNLLLIAPPAIQRYSRDMTEGAQGYCRKAGVALTIPNEVTSDDAVASVGAFVARYVLDNPKVDGIIAGSANAAVAAAIGAESAGREIGKDVEILSKEAMPFLKLFRKGLFVFSEDIKTAGNFLARAAVNAVNNPDGPPMQMLEKPKIPEVDRGRTEKRRA